MGIQSCDVNLEGQLKHKLTSL